MRNGLPKTHKAFQSIPKFRPIIDTTNTPHYNVGKFLAGLLNPLTLNQYSLRDSFDAADAIKSIPPELFSQGYKFVPFDVESLFTNVPLRRTINVVLDRIYNKKLIETSFQKHTLKKLILDSCTKTIFSCNGTLYEQLDGVSMGSSSGPVLANIILSESEDIIVSELVNSGVIKFYRRYVDDTLLLIWPTDIQFVLDKFNIFDKNLKFTFDDFQDGNVHFLDLKITEGGIDIFRKNTHTGQYTNFSSFEHFSRKVSWVNSLFFRASKICSNPSLFILYKKFVEHHVIKLILLKISKLSARLTQAIIRDKLQRLKHTQDICTRQLITMFKCARALDKSNLYCC